MTDTEAKHGRSRLKVVENTKRRPVSQPFGANTQGAEIKFPLCDAAVRKIDGGEWDLADAIVAECPALGDNGVRNGSQEKMEAMRQEIAKNYGIDLSLVRIRKLRQVAAAFPHDRRRSGVSVEGHLEAGTPKELDALIESVPKGTALTREYIRQLKRPTEKAEQAKQKDERRRQVADREKALQDICKQQDRKLERLEVEKEEREQRYIDLCHSIDKEPEPFSPPLSPEEEPTRTVAEDLEQGLRALLLSRGFDPAVHKQAVADFVKAVLAQQP